MPRIKHEKRDKSPFNRPAFIEAAIALAQTTEAMKRLTMERSAAANERFRKAAAAQCCAFTALVLLVTPGPEDAGFLLGAAADYLKTAADAQGLGDDMYEHMQMCMSVSFVPVRKPGKRKS